MFTTRKWWLLVIAALLPLSARADGLLSNNFTVAKAGTSIDTIGTAIAYHKITWNVSGTASVCTVALDTSADGVTWSAGGAITGQTCTSNGVSAIVNVIANYVRINVTALTVTAGSSVTVTWTGGVSASGAGGTRWQGCGSRGIGDGLNAIAAGTYLQFACVNDTGSTITISSIHCWTDNAGTSTLNAANNAGTALLTGAVTCNATKASGGAAGTQSATVTLANGDAISFTFVADGTSKQTNWTVTGTY